MSFFGGRLRISPFIIPAALIMLVGREAEQVLSFFAAFVLHEAAHALAARCCCAKITSFELLPFGCAALWDGFFSSGAKEAFTAAAGPGANIIAAAAVRLFFSGACADAFAGISTGLAAVNLLPAFPLDGGRIMSAVLGLFMKKRTADAICSVSGIICGAAALAAFVFLAVGHELNLSAGICGAFMLFSALKSLVRREESMAELAAQKRHAAFDPSVPGGMEVKHTAVSDSKKAGELIGSLDPKKYNVILLFDKELKQTGSIDEGELYSLIAQKGALAPLKPSSEQHLHDVL